MFRPSKTTTQTRGTLLEIDGVLSDLSGLAVEGYEIHMGETVRDASAKPLVRLLRREGEIEDGCQTENAFGTYLHGVFDAPEAALRTAQALAKKKGVTLTGEALDTHAQEQQYDKLADSVRKSLDMEWIYRIMEGKSMTGLIHLYCGGGKGKTTAAVGLTVRCAGRGKQGRVRAVSQDGTSGECRVLAKLPDVTVMAANPVGSSRSA